MTVAVVVAVTLLARKGRPPRVPGERSRKIAVYFAESEFQRVRQAAAANFQSVSEFARLAMSEAAAESGAAPVLSGQPRSGDRRRRNGADQPIELDRRRKGQ